MKQKTNEQIACNNWEKIGAMKERERILEITRQLFIAGVFTDLQRMKLIEYIKREEK